MNQTKEAKLLLNMKVVPSGVAKLALPIIPGIALFLENLSILSPVIVAFWIRSRTSLSISSGLSQCSSNLMLKHFANSRQSLRMTLYIAGAACMAASCIPLLPTMYCPI